MYCAFLAAHTNAFAIHFTALVFDSEFGSQSSLKSAVNISDFPSYVSYKIRMDIDRVDSTYKFKVTDR